MAVKEAVLVGAVDLARAAAEDVADRPELVGEHLGTVHDGERLVSHLFATTAPGYRGWRWTVTLARVPRGRTATVCEVELLPGEDSILAPAWVPWSERLRPGDVGPGDVLPFQEEDERLEPGYTATGDDADELAFELGLGRERVLSREGRAQAATRWYRGSHGPMTSGAMAAAAPCSTCGFLLLMAGSMRQAFGVCANEWSPDDGRVVSLDHGCGAHSQTDVTPVRSEWPAAPVDLDVELVQLLTPAPEPGEAETPEPGTAETDQGETAAPTVDVDEVVALEAAEAEPTEPDTPDGESAAVPEDG